MIQVLYSHLLTANSAAFNVERINTFKAADLDSDNIRNFIVYVLLGISPASDCLLPTFGAPRCGAF
jgi:hypothetical protein